MSIFNEDPKFNEFLDEKEEEINYESGIDEEEDDFEKNERILTNNEWNNNLFGDPKNSKFNNYMQEEVTLGKGVVNPFGSPWGQRAQEQEPPQPRWQPSGTVYGDQGSRGYNSNPYYNVPPAPHPQPAPSWAQNFGTTRTYQPQQPAQPKLEIPRTKRILFCNVQDVLIESLSGPGMLGMPLRGGFDLKLKFDVWNKIACFGVDYIVGLGETNASSGTEQAQAYCRMVSYVMDSLAEYLRMPYNNCYSRIINGYVSSSQLADRVKLLISTAGENIKLDQILYLGANSGLPGQSGRDKIAAESIGIDYIDLNQLCTIYQ